MIWIIEPVPCRSIRCRVVFNGVSESTWEADVRNDVFGKVRDDSRLRIDKRPYEFIEQDTNNSTRSVKRRIPDATLGLRAYTETQLDKGFMCDVENCDIDHRNMEPHKNLSKERLLNMTNQHECGLVVDGVWGIADIIFPWAVYEAKKQRVNVEKAEDQIYHAAQTYLAMLDDLARDPEDVTRYQIKESQKHQMFCFTSSGSNWGVYLVYELLGSCKVDTLWEGNVAAFSRAYDLLCITEQIQEYAVTQHRDFVIKHLEPWYKRCQRFYKPWEEYDFENSHIPGWAKAKSLSTDMARKKAELNKGLKSRHMDHSPQENEEEIRSQKVNSARQQKQSGLESSIPAIQEKKAQEKPYLVLSLLKQRNVEEEGQKR